MSNKIPEFKTIEEMAEFWQKNSPLDYKDELEEVTEPVFEQEDIVSIYLPREEVETVKKIAETQGVGYTELIREWVIEKTHSA